MDVGLSCRENNMQQCANSPVEIMETRKKKETEKNQQKKQGDARDIDVLREEGIRDDCAFVALGDTSEKNIVCAIVAKDLGAVKTIAQIEDIQYFDEAQNLDIDAVVNKKLLTSSRIYQILLDSYLDSPVVLPLRIRRS